MRDRSREKLLLPLQFCFEQVLSVQRFFKHLLVVLRPFYFLLLLCFGLHFAVLFVAFCDFGVSVHPTDPTLAFTLFLFSLLEGVLFKAR